MLIHMLRLTLQRAVFIFFLVFGGCPFAVSAMLPPPLPAAFYTMAILKAVNISQLQKERAKYIAASAHPWLVIPWTPALLKHGVSHENVLLIRQRLRVLGELLPEQDSGKTTIDAALILAIQSFQFHHALLTDGRLTKNTLLEMNIKPQERIQQLSVNIARWQNIAATLGSRYIWVNIPEFRLYLIDQGKRVLAMNVIVGRLQRPTPELTSIIDYIVFNPYWHVPKMIADRDIIPKILKNPNYLIEKDIKVYDRWKTTEIEVNPKTIDWQQVRRSGFNYFFRQEPGIINALGLVKFDFANPYNVYLHDTPEKELFSQTVRTFSSGCIRLAKPFELVNYFDEKDDNLTPALIRTILQHDKTTYYKINQPMPIAIVYFTAWTDESGGVHFNKDIYHRDN